MADSKIMVQGVWMKAMDNGDGTYSIGAELTPSTSIIGKVGIDQVTANANEVVTKSGSITTATLNAETTKVIGTVNDKIADGSDVALGAKADAAATVADTTPFTAIALLKGIWNKLDAVALTGNNVGRQSSATITLAAGTDAHDALDVVSTAAGAVMEFVSVGVANDLICVMGSRVKYAVNALPTAHAGYRLHLYKAAPTAIADDAAFNVPATDLAKYIGYIPVSSLVDVGDNCISQDNNVNYTCKLAGTSLFGILQCIAAETPAASAVYTISLNTVTV